MRLSIGSLDKIPVVQLLLCVRTAYEGCYFNRKSQPQQCLPIAIDNSTFHSRNMRLCQLVDSSAGVAVFG